MEYLTFSNGDKIPVIGLGTWKSDPGEVGEAVKAALKVGYRHIDCAAIYGNEAEIGRALSQKITRIEVRREDLWITSKLWNNAHMKADVIPALKETLHDLKMEYLDLYLIHWPVAFRPNLEGFPETDNDFISLEEVPIIETWEAMLEAKERGLVRHVGVSNFSIKKLKNLITKTDDIPEMNQVEMHPYLQQNDLLTYCRNEKIHITAYSPLGSSDRPDFLKSENEPSLLDNEIIHEIAEKHTCTTAQVLISWAIQRNTVVIPKSTNPGRIEENLQSINLELDEEDMNKIKSLDVHYRYVNGAIFETESDMYRNIFDEQVTG